MAEYIEREAVFKAYEETQRRSLPWSFEALIGSIPAADVAPVVHARWIGGYLKNDLTLWCSECKEENDGAKKWCPNCGAKMDEDENNGLDSH